MVTHILKDGTRLADIKGHVIKKEDCPAVYALLAEINRPRSKSAGPAEREKE